VSTCKKRIATKNNQTSGINLWQHTEDFWLLFPINSGTFRALQSCKIITGIVAMDSWRCAIFFALFPSIALLRPYSCKNPPF
jgi:hypothetical protein